MTSCSVPLSESQVSVICVQALLQAHDGVVNGQISRGDQENVGEKYGLYPENSPYEARKCRPTKGGFLGEDGQLKILTEEEVSLEDNSISFQSTVVMMVMNLFIL